jgi:O-antigen/teichoic acid export membrane protein
VGAAVTGRRRPRIVSQTSLILGGQILSGIVLFVTTPYIALGLGAERYGLYTLLFLFLGYSSALDFGLSFALVKHVAEHDPQTDRTEIDSLVNTATAVYALIAAAFIIALVVGREWIAGSLLHVPEAQARVARISVLLLACSIPFATASTVFNALFRGLLRFEYVSLFSIVNASVYSIAAALFVVAGASIQTLIVLYGVVTAASAVVQWTILRRILPGFYPRPRLETKRLRQLFGFGSFMAINQVSSLALLQLDRLVIARALSVSMAAYYTIPFNISQRLNMLGAAAATVAFPHSSASIARGELDDFRRQHLQSARVVAWLTLAPTLAVIVMADQILRYWMSPEFALYGTMSLRLLAFGRLWISIASLDAVSIEGSGRPWITALFMGVTGAMNVIGLLLLTPVWGLGGAAASVTFSLLVLAALDVWYCSRIVTRSRPGLWSRSVVVPAIITSSVSLPVAVLLRKAVGGLPSLIIVVLLTAGFTVVVGYWLFLAKEERVWAKATFARLWLSRGVVRDNGNGVT